jgi:hypothetical protein
MTPPKQREEPAYRKHLFIIAILLIIQFFVLGTTRSIYLNYSRHLYSSRNGVDGIFYDSGEYTPRSGLAFNSRPDNEFSFVRENGGINEEIFYFSDGSRSVVTYVDGQWRSTFSTKGAVLAGFLFLPTIGFALFMVATIRKIVRTRAIFTWELMKYPADGTEKLLTLYGVPLFISGIVFGFKMM